MALETGPSRQRGLHRGQEGPGKSRGRGEQGLVRVRMQ